MYEIPLEMPADITSPTARVEIARCAACAADGPVLTMGMAEDEYGAVSLCELCIFDGFRTAQAQASSA